MCVRARSESDPVEISVQQMRLRSGVSIARNSNTRAETNIGNEYQFEHQHQKGLNKAGSTVEPNRIKELDLYCKSDGGRK